MNNLAVQIVRFVDDMNFPGWLEVEFIDVEGRRHTIVDKVPIFTADYLLDSKSLYREQFSAKSWIVGKTLWDARSYGS